MDTLVTGGSGFLGKSLQKTQPSWTFLSSKDCDLSDQKQTFEFFQDNKPKRVLHLAARVGGIKDNIENQAEFYYQNTMINTNVIEASRISGVKRVLSSLSTCAFPDLLPRYPFEEDDLFSGPPPKTNFSYGMTKRALHTQSCAYRSQYGLNYSTFSPSNIYGPGDYFGEESSHFVAALIHKLAHAPKGSTVKFWGDGLPMRQQLYVYDLCEIIPTLLERHNSAIPIIVAPSENLTIMHMVRTLVKETEKDVIISFSGEASGQFRKDGSNDRIIKLLGDYEFTTFRKGVMKTYKWYMENKDLYGK
jgi:GDP-L-fucose synthase